MARRVSLWSPAGCRPRAPTWGRVRCAGLALGVYLTCRFRRSETLSISASGRDADAIPATPDNLIWQTALTVARDHGTGDAADRAGDPQRDSARQGNGIERGRAHRGRRHRRPAAGLRWKPLRILDEAARLEGHPDNVAPCTLGSIVASAIDSGGVARAVRLDAAAALRHRDRGAGFRPAHFKARAVLPSGYSREDAVFNVQRAALLIAALATGTTSLPRRARRPLPPALSRGAGAGLHEILKLRAPGLLGCALSGAGPSILVFFERGYEERLRPGAADLPPARPRVGDAALPDSRARFRTHAGGALPATVSGGAPPRDSMLTCQLPGSTLPWIPMRLLLLLVAALSQLMAADAARDAQWRQDLDTLAARLPSLIPSCSSRLRAMSSTRPSATCATPSRTLTTPKS